MALSMEPRLLTREYSLVSASASRSGRPSPAAPALSQQRRGVFVVVEETPNPDSAMFYPQAREVMGPGTKTVKFNNKYDTSESPLAAALFKVKGVKQVLLAAEHVTVTKQSAYDWDMIQPNIKLVMSQFFAAGLQVIKESAIVREAAATVEPGSLEEQILELLEERVRPFVQQDGGDVEFENFDRVDGTLYLRMHGACSGCPKSNVTLQMGIKNLMQHYIPEVKDVLEAEDEEEIPRPGR